MTTIDGCEATCSDAAPTAAIALAVLQRRALIGTQAEVAAATAAAAPALARRPPELLPVAGGGKSVILKERNDKAKAHAPRPESAKRSMRSSGAPAPSDTPSGAPVLSGVQERTRARNEAYDD